MRIEFTTKEKLDIEKINTISNFNNKNTNIYKYKLNTEDAYFESSNQNIITILDDKIYIVDLSGIGLIEDTLINSINKILNSENIDLLLDFYNRKDGYDYKLTQNNVIGPLEKLGIYYVEIKSINIIDFTEAKEQIALLNKKMNCTGYNISLGYLFQMEQNTIIKFHSIYSLYLCIFDKEMCISSIQIQYIDNSIVINTRTEKNYENKKLNILLCATLIIIANKLYPNIQYVTSQAVNPITAHIMHKYFKAELYNKFGNNLECNEYNYKCFEDYINNNNNNTYITTKISINEENINNAITVFHSIMKTKCDNKNGGKNTIRKKTKKTKKYNKISKKSRNKNHPKLSRLSNASIRATMAWKLFSRSSPSNK